MQTIQTRQRTDSAGTLTLTVPLGEPDTEYDIVLVAQSHVNGKAPKADPWAGADAIHARLAATGRDFGDSAQEIREDRDR